MNESTLRVISTTNLISLAKVEHTGRVYVYVRKLKDGLIQITYVGRGITHKLKSSALLAPRMISSLLGADYAEVTLALKGVA